MSTKIAATMAFVTLAMLVPGVEATLPEASSIAWTGGTASTATGTTLVSVPDAATDGEKFGFIYFSPVTSSYGCRFVYGDVGGWTTSVVHATAKNCIAVKFLSGDTWVVLFQLTNNTYYTAVTHNNGAQWTTMGHLPSGLTSSGGVDRYRFFVHSAAMFTVLPNAGTGSGIYYTNDGGVTWANAAGGNCVVSNGFNGATDIEYPIAITGSTLTYAVPAGGLITMDASGTCGTGQTLTFPLPESGAAITAVSSVGTTFFKGGASACSGPANSIYNTGCRSIFSEYSQHPLSFSLTGDIGIIQVTNGVIGEMVFYDSTTYVKSTITSLIFSPANNRCALVMASTHVYCFYLGSTTTQVKFITTQIAATPTLEEPSEFDSGLVAFTTGLGFVTPESQFFFAILLIGITTVTGGVTLKFMAPGRLKLILISGMAMLVGVFLVVLGAFDLWMYVLAFVLAGTLIRGSNDFRSTWHELRDRIANRGQTFTEDGAAVSEDSFGRIVAKGQSKEAATQAIEQGNSPAAEGTD